MDSPLAAGSSMISPSSKPRNQLRRGVRVVGKIRPFLDSKITASVGSSQISFTSFYGEYTSVTFSDQSNRGGDWKNGGNCHSETLPDLVSPMIPEAAWAHLLEPFNNFPLKNSYTTQDFELDLLNVTQMTA